MKGEPISSGYLSDHETKLQDMVQQLSVESQDSRFCYLTSSEVCFGILNRKIFGLKKVQNSSKIEP